MAPRKKIGRAAAEAAYANLLKENTALVGNVGEAWDTYVAKLEDAAVAREHYEQARAAAVKGGAVTNDQLDQMGYKKTAKLPAPPPRTPPEATHDSDASASSRQSDRQTNGATAGPVLASVGAANPGSQS
ncbi:hypothetical protein [Mycobacterium xenopi]|uniref:hypothetical protein n=1 Tax=Mycobacterium xenopi TaxID=1789 RepID=UPI000A15E083|nr:hypothetical protein [Mycobacterium xenopi]ORX14138.1 hypothetical protein AWC32_14240 [Mycobacterium xenopi]SPX94858.1 Uncharacterised protein [Mycobacterium xenopi]